MKLKKYEPGRARAWLYKAGFKARSNRDREPKPAPRDLKRDYLAGMTLKELSYKHRVPPWVVTRWRDEAGLKPRPLGGVPAKAPSVEHWRILKLIHTQSYRTVAAKFGITGQAVGAVVKRWRGVVPLPEREYRKRFPVPKGWKQDYLAGVKLSALAKKYRTTLLAMQRWRLEAELPPRRPRKAKPRQQGTRTRG
jgi:hypothetical protein